MSGLKRTTWSYEDSRAAAERARRLRLEEEARRAEVARREAAMRALEEATAREVQEQVSSLAPELRRLAQQLQRSSALIDPVSRRAFESELGDADRLAKQSIVTCNEAERLAQLTGRELVSQGVDASSQPISQLRELITLSVGMVEQAEKIRFHDGPLRQQQLAARIGKIGASIARASSFDDSVQDITKWSSELEQLRETLLEGQFDEVERASEQLNSAVSAWTNTALAVREARLERLTVLDALRDSCRQLGYRELNPDELERSIADADAPWTLVVDTRTKGTISFTVETEAIRAETGMGVRGDTIVADYCFTEFERIEDELARDHGLRTHFLSEAIDRPVLPAGKRTAARNIPAAKSTGLNPGAG